MIDATPYPREERVDAIKYDFRPQPFLAGEYDEEGPRYQSLMSALQFFM